MSNKEISQDVIQNLKDAGCDPKCIEEFSMLEREGKERDQITLLFVHRKHLLDQIHKEEKQISCLDYLIHRIEKQRKV